jgi:hypothetical protein
MPLISKIVSATPSYSYEFSLIDDTYPGAEFLCQLQYVGAEEYSAVPIDEIN